MMGVEGEHIGPFQVRELLGSGATGRVYRCIGADGRAVAVKVPQQGREEQWRLEVATLARLSKRGVPGIVRILDVAAPPQAWYAMDLVSGRSLREALRPPADVPAASFGQTEPVGGAAPAARRQDLEPWPPRVPADPLEVPALLRATASVAATLSHLHATGLAHGDLKPENIVLGADGVPVLIDFGSAAVSMGEDLRERAVVPSQPWMTAGYVAPEVARGEPATPRSDLFALGCMLFEILTGALPARGTAPRLLWPPSTSEWASPELRLLVEALLQPEPAERSCFAADVTELLQHALEPQVAAAPLPRPLHRPRHVGRASALATIQQVIQALGHQPGGLIVVEGESGAGKTRLLAEVVRLGRGLPARFVVAATDDAARGAGAVQLEGPLRLALREAASERPAPSFVAALAAEIAPAAVAAASRAGTPQQFYAELYRSTLWLAEAQPVVLVVDDLQLASDGTRALLDALLHGAMRNVVAVVSYAGGQLDDGLQTLAGKCCAHVVLPRMSEEELRSLLRDALAAPRLPASLTRAVVERSAGNPRYALELAQAALQAGLVRRAGGEWLPRASGEELAATLPASLDQLFLQRYRRLSSSARDLLQLLTLLGGRQPAAAALELGQCAFSLGVAEADSALEELLQCGIVRQTSDSRCELTHPALEEFVRGRMTAETTRSLHRLVASWLERTREEGEHDGQLGLHWLEAGEHERAAPHLIRAGRHQLAQHQLRRAERSFARALDCIDALPGGALPSQDCAVDWHGEALVVSDTLADVRAQLGWSEEAVQALRRVVETARLPLQRARALRRWGALSMASHRYEVAEQKYVAALSELTAAGPAEQQEHNDIQLCRIENSYYQRNTRGMRTLVDQLSPVLGQWSALQRGKLALCVANLLFQEAGFAYTQAAGEEWLRAISLMDQSAAEPAAAALAQVDLGMALSFGGAGEWEASSRHLAAGVRAADQISDLKLLARGRAYLSTVLRRLKQVAQVEREAQLCIDVAEACQLRAYLAVGWGNLSWTALMRGEEAQAVTLAERALELWRQLEEPYPMQWIAAFPLLAALVTGPASALASPLQVLLDPRQQRLPDELAHALTSALHCEIGARSDAARQALRVAHEWRFL